MADLLTGADAVVDEVLSYQKLNKIKNNYRAAAAPANIQPGVLFSDSDTDQLYHAGAASAQEEVLQLTRSKAASPQFASLRLMDTNASHYLSLVWNEDRSAAQTLNIITGAADRTITLSGNTSLNQDLLTTSTVQHLRMGLGIAPQDHAFLYASGDNTTGVSQYGYAVDNVFSGTTVSRGVYVGGSVKASTTVVAWSGVYIDNPSLGVSAAITTQYGVFIAGQTRGSANFSLYATGDAYFTADVSALTYTDRV